jgi:seryl-tRNA synthetase
MLDPGLLRDQMDVLRAAMSRRGISADTELEQLATLEASRRRLIPELEGLKREQNAAGEEVARAKRQGLDPRSRMSKSAGTARRRPTTSSPSRIGTSVRRSVSSISNGPRACQGRDSRC